MYLMLGEQASTTAGLQCVMRMDSALSVQSSQVRSTIHYLYSVVYRFVMVAKGVKLGIMN